MSDPIIHLLIPKEFRVWCRPEKPVGDYPITRFASKATCANCLTRYRTNSTGRCARFKVVHTGRELDPDPFADWKHPDTET